MTYAPPTSTMVGACRIRRFSSRSCPRLQIRNIVRVHLINPSDTAFGTAVITPRWLFVLATATPSQFGDPVLCDETIEQLDAGSIATGDVVGIGIHTGNALRGYALGRIAKLRGAFVIFGGIHATLYPDEAFDRGAADCVVRGDGDLAWGEVLRDYVKGSAKRVYEGGRVDPGGSPERSAGTYRPASGSIREVISWGDPV